MKKSRLTRRQFLTRGAHGAGILATGALALSGANAAEKDSNPFAYDVERLRRTDPNLIRYEEVGKFKVPHPQPRRLSVGGPDNRVYIAAGNYVDILERNGSRVTEITLSGTTRCVAVALDGTTFVGMRDHIEVFDGKGQQKAVWDSPGKRSWLTGLALNENSIFAADAGGRVVLHYDKSGKLAGRIGEKNKERNIPGLIVPSPYLDVVVAKDGLLRVNDPGRHRVEAYTVAGDLELFWGKPSAGIEGFCGCCNPIGLALLNDGSCITCEKGLPRVKVYSSEGKFESVVAGPESFPENANNGNIHDKSDGMLGGLDAAVDAEGRIYVLDLVAAEVRIMKHKA